MSVSRSMYDPLVSLTLLGLPHVGPRTVEKLHRSFRTVESLRAAAPHLLSAAANASVTASVLDDTLWRNAEEKALKALEVADREGMRVISVEDSSYPNLLRQTSDPPAVLFVRGNLSRSPKAVACVGTRRPTKFGEIAADRVASFFAERGWGVVSGLALGIDSVAHKAALRANAYTVAVLGNGLQEVYPKENAALADAILSAGGAVISEQPPGVAVSSKALVRRDRIQSGLSFAVFVIQSTIDGGTMHTARFALEQKRHLFVPVPPEKFAREKESEGTRVLAQVSASDLGSHISLERALALDLRSRFGELPVARAIGSKDEYAEIEAALSRDLSSAELAPISLLL